MSGGHFLHPEKFCNRVSAADGHYSHLLASCSPIKRLKVMAILFKYVPIKYKNETRLLHQIPFSNFLIYTHDL